MGQRPLTPDEGLVEGDLGAVVGVYWRGGYEVEFAGADGTTLAVVTLGPGKLRKRRARDILHVREVA
ncbi:MAG TPA: DUF4926 domain-containing protein [Jiangellaceae bacterium]|nr:DUF4926 domain-containing protein [Jiangellaceae bacterium]